MLKRVRDRQTFGVVLLVLFANMWHKNTCTPLKARSQLADGTRCIGLTRSLLWNITQALEVEHLFNGIDCTEQRIEASVRTKTVSVCAPKNSTCSGKTVLSFDKDECLQNIVEDLRHYRSVIQAHPDPDRILYPTLLRSIDDLLENCFSVILMEDSLPEEKAVGENPFDDRLKLCKVLKGFHVRAITINRIMGYIVMENTDE